MKKISLVVLSVFLCSQLIEAQNITGNLEGSIVDTTGTPIPGVNISLQSESLQGTKGFVETKKMILIK